MYRRAAILCGAIALLCLSISCSLRGGECLLWSRATTTDPTGGNEDFVFVHPREIRTIADLKGPGEITSLWMTTEGFAKEINRQTVLRITWDDMSEPSVRVPVGFFFNVARGRVDPYESQFVSVQPTDSLNAYFRMPFRKRALIQLENQSPDAQKYFMSITWNRRAVKRDEHYFHAQFRQQKPAVPLVPYVIADVRGRGEYLGHHLDVMLKGGGWWGEGDDVYTIDGERFQGTGTEDAFESAWGFAGRGGTLRSGVSQVMNGFERGGFWNLYRFHGDARIPFREHFKLEFEHGLNGFDARPGMENNYESVAFYYLSKPQAQPPLPALKDRMLGSIPIAGPLPGGWYEAEKAVLDSQIFAFPGVAVGVANRPRNGGWSGDADATISAGKSGDRFVWALDLPTTGTMTPRLAFTRQPSGFDYQIAMNGKLLGGKISGYARVQTRDEIALPSVRANAGRNFLEFISAGADPRTTPPALHAAIDAVRFLPTEADNPIDVRPRILEARDGVILHKLVVESVGGIHQLRDRGSGVPDTAIEAELSPPGEGGLPGAIRFRTREDKIALTSPHVTDLRNDLEISFLLYAEPSGKNQVIFSRNQVMACWVNDGKLSFWLRDLDWRFLYMETRANMIPDREWCTVRLTLHGTIARIFINGAMCSELDMHVFNHLNQYPGALVLGGTDSQQSPFRGAIADFMVRAGTPGTAAGEE
ncbi:DUF2961 domain-containing protein [Candidatus Sumerlaeota bacterium]|nr:DUF2961 domain-containing protein [Candidatus Sumerlaeota bacterium]